MSDEIKRKNKATNPAGNRPVSNNIHSDASIFTSAIRIGLTEFYARETGLVTPSGSALSSSIRDCSTVYVEGCSTKCRELR